MSWRLLKYIKQAWTTSINLKAHKQVNKINLVRYDLGMYEHKYVAKQQGRECLH